MISINVEEVTAISSYSITLRWFVWYDSQKILGYPQK